MFNKVGNIFRARLKQQENTDIPLQHVIQKLNMTHSVTECMQIVNEFEDKKKIVMEYYFSGFKEDYFRNYFITEQNFRFDQINFVEQINFGFARINFGFLLHMLCLLSQNEHRHLGLFERHGLFTKKSISIYLQEECGIPEDFSAQIALGCIVMCTHSRENWFLSSSPLTASASSFITDHLKLCLKRYLGHPDVHFSYEKILCSLTDSAAKDDLLFKELKKMLESPKVFQEMVEEKDFVVIDGFENL